MDFPNRPGEPLDINQIPAEVIKGIGNVKPIKAYKSRDLMLVFESEKDVASIEPDFQEMIKYPDAVIVTAPADNENLDFISRFFCPYDMGIPEDPVTGSAHCTLTPYWADELGKTTLKARQISERGGNLNLELKNDRVFISGQTKLYLKGEIYI